MAWLNSCAAVTFNAATPVAAPPNCFFEKSSSKTQ